MRLEASEDEVATRGGCLPRTHRVLLAHFAKPSLIARTVYALLMAIFCDDEEAKERKYYLYPRFCLSTVTRMEVLEETRPVICLSLSALLWWQRPRGQCHLLLRRALISTTL